MIHKQIVCFLYTYVLWLEIVKTFHATFVWIIKLLTSSAVWLMMNKLKSSSPLALKTHVKLYKRVYVLIIS